MSKKIGVYEMEASKWLYYNDNYDRFFDKIVEAFTPWTYYNTVINFLQEKTVEGNDKEFTQFLIEEELTTVVGNTKNSISLVNSVEKLHQAFAHYFSIDERLLLIDYLIDNNYINL